MTNWCKIYKFKDRMIDISVGMWINDDCIYFTLEGLEPQDVIDQDIEFGVSVKDLEFILTKAKKIQTL